VRLTTTQWIFFQSSTIGNNVWSSYKRSRHIPQQGSKTSTSETLTPSLSEPSVSAHSFQDDRRLDNDSCLGIWERLKSAHIKYQRHLCKSRSIVKFRPEISVLQVSKKFRFRFHGKGSLYTFISSLAFACLIKQARKWTYALSRSLMMDDEALTRSPIRKNVHSFLLPASSAVDSAINQIINSLYYQSAIHFPHIKHWLVRYSTNFAEINLDPQNSEYSIVLLQENLK
jgi:hypothetical protein